MSDVRRSCGRRVNVALIVIGVIAVVMAGLLVFVVTRSDERTSGREPVDSVRGAIAIRSFDGVTLAAQVTEPRTTDRAPLVVMPASYGASSVEYLAIARRLTSLGFVTVSYTQRGFRNSGGEIDFAGPATQRDARTVIDWALKHTRADPKHVGMLGISYGAGISLLTAAQDARVRAVVALSTWTDLVRAFRPNHTTSVSALGSLLSNSRLNPATQRLAQQLRSNPFTNGPRFDTFVRTRSPVTYVSDLNRNRPAIMIANGWEDSLFAPTMLPRFFAKLTTPKRLQLAVGDHGGPERTMIEGRASRSGTAAYAWLAHYLAGVDNGVQREQPVQLEDVTTKIVTGYPAWPSAAVTRSMLASPTVASVSVGSSPSAWQTRLRVGQESAAQDGGGQYTVGSAFRPQVTKLSQTSDNVVVWRAAPLAMPTHVLGTIRLSLAIASSVPDASVFAYVYDVDAAGTGRLITNVPYTVTGAGETPKPVSFGLEPIDWTLPAGHHLAVAVDTVEPRWFQAARTGTTITLSSSASHPARLDVPLA